MKKLLLILILLVSVGTTNTFAQEWKTTDYNKFKDLPPESRTKCLTWLDINYHDIYLDFSKRIRQDRKRKPVVVTQKELNGREREVRDQMNQKSHEAGISNNSVKVKTLPEFDIKEYQSKINSKRKEINTKKENQKTLQESLAKKRQKVNEYQNLYNALKGKFKNMTDEELSNEVYNYNPSSGYNPYSDQQNQALKEMKNYAVMNKYKGTNLGTIETNLNNDLKKEEDNLAKIDNEIEQMGKDLNKLIENCKGNCK